MSRRDRTNCTRRVVIPSPIPTRSCAWTNEGQRSVCLEARRWSPALDAAIVQSGAEAVTLLGSWQDDTGITFLARHVGQLKKLTLLGSVRDPATVNELVNLESLSVGGSFDRVDLV